MGFISFPIRADAASLTADPEVSSSRDSRLALSEQPCLPSVFLPLI